MSVKKCGVELFCESCKYLRDSQDGGFEIDVPLSMGDGELSGMAKLHCVVSSERHRVELIELLDAESRTVHPSSEDLAQVSAALDFVGQHCICGNQRICPPEIVRVVKARGRS